MKRLVERLIKERPIKNKEAILAARKAINYVKKNKPNEFKTIKTKSIIDSLRNRATHKLKPAYSTEKAIFDCVLDELTKLSMKKSYFDSVDCSRALLDSLFMERPYKNWDKLTRWGIIPLWVHFIYDIIKEIFNL